MRKGTGVFFLAMMSLVLLAAIPDAHGQIIGNCTSNADCEDHNICTTDICDTRHNCVYGSNIGLPCQPENHCYGAGQCDGSVCVAQGPLLTCDDGNPCTVDSCEYTTGCVHEGETCDDGNACTRDTCTLPDICSHDQPTDCDDGDPCTLDGCDPSSGCTHQGTNCDDGNPCTIDTCTAPGTCVHNQSACDDANSCTHDVCDPVTGECSHRENGSCTENPKSVGYWRRVCGDNGNNLDTISNSDVSFIQANACAPYLVHSPDDVCRILLLNGVERCLHAEQEFLALALNLNHGRVFFSSGIDSHCSDLSTVGDAFSDARHLICGAAPCLASEPCYAAGEGDCGRAECECREINQGRALHVHGLVASRLTNGTVRLSWIAPVGDADDLAATPRRYRVWRATDASGPFVQIAEVADTTFDDTAPTGERLVYDVTPVW